MHPKAIKCNRRAALLSIPNQQLVCFEWGIKRNSHSHGSEILALCSRCPIPWGLARIVVGESHSLLVLSLTPLFSVARLINAGPSTGYLVQKSSEWYATSIT